MKKVLILNGSFCETPVIKKAKEMGFYTISTGNDPTLEGHSFSDEYIHMDYSDKENILSLIMSHSIDGVISCANDFGTITTAYVNDKMGWIGRDSLENVLLLHHKDRFKAYCAAKDIPSVISHSFTEKETLLAYARNCDYPIIIKANDLTGGKGIQKAENFQEAISAAEYAFSASRAKNVLVEPFIIGTQHAVDAFIANGKIIASTSCNCISSINPYLIQTETYPCIYEEDIKPICQIIQNMVDDLHLADGVFTVQYMRNSNGIYILEVMRRLTGNLSFTLYEKASGFPWYEGYILSQLGLPCDHLKSAAPEAKYCGHHGIFARGNGIIEDYEIPSDIQRHIYQLVELKKRGERIQNYMFERIASFFYTYDSHEEMNHDAKEFFNRVVVHMREE
ncbi:MAG: ATP-grasp domain-containing protein [Clostridia bacterium]|nr:ATP-grasp domain-containing protein [Clostridia bacterium]